MRVGTVNNYFWMRFGRTVGIYMIAILVFLLVGLFIMMPYATERVLQVGVDGDIAIEQTNSGLTMYVDPSVIVSVGSYSYVIAILALLLIGRERQFFVSMSTSRYEVLLGSLLFLVTMSAALAVVGGLLLPILVRLVLSVAGFTTRGGWSAQVILTGGDTLWWRTVILNFLDMVEMAGWVTLAGYLIKRWWKAMLIIGGAGIVLVILLATQLSSTRYVQMLAEWAINAINWFIEDAWPAMERYFAETNLGIIALRKIGAGVVLTALSYPVMRWMKVG